MDPNASAPAPPADPTEALANQQAEGREAAVAAVREALAAEGDGEAAPPKEGEAERGPDGKFKPRKGAKPEPAAKESPAEEAISASERIKQVMANRAERHRARQTQAEAERIRSELQQELDAVKKERAFLEGLRKSPKAAIRESGWNGEDLIMDLARDGTPEGKFEARLREERIAREAAEKRLEALEKTIAEDREHSTRRQQQEAQRKVEWEFLQAALDKEKAPTLERAFRQSPYLLLEEGHRVAAEYHRRTNEWLKPGEVAAYLESVYSERLGGSQSRASGNGSAPRQRATGSATVTTSSASERRTIAKPPDDLTADQRREDAIAAAKRAIREAQGGGSDRTH